MKRYIRSRSPEALVLAALLLLSVLALVFMDNLVAPPKLLFGRALSAIMPSLMPTIVIATLAVLCAILLVMGRALPAEVRDEGLTATEWQRGLAFFGIMVLYALTMQPLGFLISSAIAIALLSVLMGNRSVVQTALLSIIGPAVLYLAATRLLAVSLPELNMIELAYSRLLGE